jgi:hypothetical protein
MFLTPELAAALEARAEAASPDLHELRGRVAGAQYFVLIIALFFFGMAALRFGVVEDRETSDWVELYGCIAIGGLFLGLFVLGRKFPGAAVSLAAIVWVVLQALDFVASPAKFFLALVGALGIMALMCKVATLFVLARAALANFQATRLRTELGTRLLGVRRDT